MANLSAVLNEISTVKAIDLHYEAERIQRRRLGLSQAGHACARFLWYTHRGYDQPGIDGRTLRLFKLGEILEAQTIADLHACGFKVHSRQLPVEITYNGTTLTGSIDGIIEGLIESPATPHLFEHKTASKKKYDELTKKNYRTWNETYFWQVQFYMLGLGIKRAAIFVYCKDDSRLYMERIKLEKESAISRLQRVFDAILQVSPPERLCPRADFFSAKWCPYYSECFKGVINDH